MAMTHYFVRNTNGVDAPGRGTTHALAYRTIQYALNDIGVTHGRNTVDGNQVNICDEAPQALAASLTLATYGVPTSSAPLLLRGYTTAANDGGRGAIQCGTFSVCAGQPASVRLVDLDISGSVQPVLLGADSALLRCTVTSGAVARGGTAFLVLLGTSCSVIQSRIEEPLGTNGRLLDIRGSSLVYRSVLGRQDSQVLGSMLVLISSLLDNLFLHSHVQHQSAGGSWAVTGNTFWHRPGSGTHGLYIIETPSRYLVAVANNIFVNMSGAGGRGIDLRNPKGTVLLGHNAFFNCAAQIVYAAPTPYVPYLHEVASDVTLTADPFVNAVGGDFRLTDIARAQLVSTGWPPTYLASTLDPQAAIGALQYGEPVMAGGGGGGPIIGGRIIRGIGAV